MFRVVVDIRICGLLAVFTTDENVLSSALTHAAAELHILAETYSKRSASAVAHKLVHEAIKPAFLILLKTHEIMLVIYETLIFPSNLICEIEVVFIVPMRPS